MPDDRDPARHEQAPAPRWRIAAFWGSVLLVLAVGGWLGYQIRPNLMGMSVGVLIACGPVMLVGVVVGIVETMRGARTESRPR